jgi:hypothetical protein
VATDLRAIASLGPSQPVYEDASLGGRDREHPFVAVYRPRKLPLTRIVIAHSIHYCMVAMRRRRFNTPLYGKTDP